MDVTDRENEILAQFSGAFIPQPELDDTDGLEYAEALRYLRNRDLKLLYCTQKCCDRPTVLDVLTNMIRRYEDETVRNTLGKLFEEDNDFKQKCREAECLRRFLLLDYPDHNNYATHTFGYPY